ncbi:hypothetical protein QBC43DRAFT_328599 [Cladorrhinum sp. PSN259]|nr:hypothetical protein QBC43DRAFT_328599 [Cladorrhinum sp. PSN259]
MVPQLEIHVDGKGSCLRTAERCFLHLSIGSTNTDQSKAFNEAQDTVANITNTIRALATKAGDGSPHADAAVTAFTVTPLSTVSQYQLDKSYRVLKNMPKEHTVRASAEVIFRDMVQLAEVSSKLARMPHVSISGTEWQLTNVTRAKLEREARVKAITDAVQKAQDYAGVVGRQVIAVEIRDQLSSFGPRSMPGLYAAQTQMQQQSQITQGAAQHISNMSGVASDGLTLEPKTITVSVCVTARFISNDEGGDGMEASSTKRKRV